MNTCTCSEILTAGKPWCPIHDNYAGIPQYLERRSGVDRRTDLFQDIKGSEVAAPNLDLKGG